MHASSADRTHSVKSVYAEIQLTRALHGPLWQRGTARQEDVALEEAVHGRSEATDATVCGAGGGAGGGRWPRWRRVAAWAGGGETLEHGGRAAAAQGRSPQLCASACDQGAVSTCACAVMRWVRAVARTSRRKSPHANSCRPDPTAARGPGRRRGCHSWRSAGAARAWPGPPSAGVGGAIAEARVGGRGAHASTCTCPPT